MKKICLLLVYVCFVCWGTNAQTSDEYKVSINALVADENIPEEATRNLENKLRRALTINGIADNGYAERFVLTAKVDIISKDIAPTTPPRISQKMELTLMVGDVVENKVYESCNLTLAGIGTSETKAFVTAFQKFNPQNEEIQSMLTTAKEKIVAYYTNNCDAIIQQAETLANMNKMDEAISQLVSVPNICSDCYQRCQDKASSIYIQKINSEGVVLLQKAKAEWMKQPDASGASIICGIITQINPKASNYNEIIKFRKEIENKLQADAKRDWDFQMKKYEDNQAFKRSIVDACQAIGVAFGNGQPKNTTKNIVRKWK